jgi:hypothetical protein
MAAHQLSSTISDSLDLFAPAKGSVRLDRIATSLLKMNPLVINNVDYHFTGDLRGELDAFAPDCPEKASPGVLDASWHYDPTRRVWLTELHQAFGHQCSDVTGCGDFLDRRSSIRGRQQAKAQGQGKAYGPLTLRKHLHDVEPLQISNLQETTIVTYGGL